RSLSRTPSRGGEEELGRPDRAPLSDRHFVRRRRGKGPEAHPGTPRKGPGSLAPLLNLASPRRYRLDRTGGAQLGFQDSQAGLPYGGTGRGKAWEVSKGVMHYRRAIAGFGVAMLVAACGQPGPSGASPSAGGASATTAATTRGQGGDLKILYWQAPTILNAHQATGVVTYTESQPFYYQWGVGGGSLILQEKQYTSCVGAAAKNCTADQKPIGTGPYKVDTFKPGDTVTYVMNENYRDAKKPYFKSVTFKGGGDAQASARASFQTGEADYAW